MTISINQITSGMGLLINGEVHLVMEYHHVKPGKGSAFVRIKLKNVKTGAVLDRTYRTADKLDDVTIAERDMEFLYADGESFHFMDHDTYEQVAVPQEGLVGLEKYLLENLGVVGFVYDHKVIKIELPNFIIAEIVETEPGFKGDSSKAGTKPAKIATGATFLVPLFINTGDNVKIDTRTGNYVERVQK